MVAVATIGAGILGAGASIYSANKAASAQKAAADKAIATQQGMFDTARAGLEPFRAAGETALPTLTSLLTPGADQTATLQNLPGYQFALSQGLKAVNNSSSARGLSGAGIKGAQNFATGLASGTYSDLVSKLLSYAGLGENAGAAVATNATTAGQGIAGTQASLGNAQGAASVAQGNAVGGLGNSLVQSLLAKQLYGGGSSGVFSPSTAGVDSHG